MLDSTNTNPSINASSTPTPKFTIGICGGGIGGITLAVCLAKYPDIKVDIYEAAQDFKEVGAGVMIWGRTWRVLTLLGMDNTLRDVAGVALDGSEDPPFGFDFRRSDLSDDHRIHLLSMPFVGQLYHRAHFLDVLLARLPTGIAHLKKRVESYAQASPTDVISLKFADGTSATCDLLVGADGVKSVVRRYMFEDLAKAGKPELLKYVEPFYSGTIAYRTLIPSELLPSGHQSLRDPIMYCGLNRHIVCYPLAKGRLVNFVGMYTEPDREGSVWEGPWASEVSVKEVYDCFETFEEQSQLLVQTVQAPLKWAIHQLHPLPTYVHGHVALLGDAAHAMTPHQGAGAGQSIEDAYILAGILGHRSVTKDTLSQALKAYDYVRRPFANAVIEGSRNAGAMYELRSKHGDDYATLAPAIQDQWDWVENEDVLAQLDRAVNWMLNEEQTDIRASL